MTQKNISNTQVNESFTDNALKMMRKRYLGESEDGSQEKPADMFRRVAKSLADVEMSYGTSTEEVKEREEEFFEIMGTQEFTPAGRTLTNAGTDTSLIANCIVLPIEDSMEGIFQTLKEASLLQQAGSGLGFSLDELRPAMSPTVRTQGYASGPVSFLKVYNEAFGTIKQQGRHGANMAMMSVDHPDVLDFIRAKAVEGAIANFNISVKVTDEFMEQLKNSPDTQWYCEWDGQKRKPQKVSRRPGGVVHKTEEIDITVGELFEEICKYAWVNGEPGIAFVDEWERTNPLPELGTPPATNPCGEQVLHAYDNCNLGSINLSQFVKGGEVDYHRLEYVTKVATRMLDNVIDKFDFPVKEVNKMARKNRRIGLGIMGFADMLFQLGIPYDSKEGRDTADKVMSTIQRSAEETSEKLAGEKGPFPNFDKSVFKDGNRRNAALTTVAPTGSISMMFDTSGGVEPNFALAYVKQDKDGEQYHYLNKHFLNALEREGFGDEEIKKIKEEVVEKGTIQHMEEIPQRLRDVFVTAMDISGEDHIRMQAVFQENVDNSISKTINLPNEASPEDIKESFFLAWRLGCKSCTVYRDGSRQVQIMNLGDGDDMVSITDFDGEKAEKEAKSIEEMHGKDENETEKKKIEKKEEAFVSASSVKDGNGKLTPRDRPDKMDGATYKIKTGYGNLYITVNNDESGEPFEIFTTIGKSGGFFQEQSEAISRLISLALRTGVSTENVIDQLKGIRGPMPVMTNKGTVLSLPDAIARVLEEHIGLNPLESQVDEASEEETVEEKENPVPVGSDKFHRPSKANPEMELADYGAMPGCPDCGAGLQISEGCLSCRNCGFSRCG